MLTIGKIAAQTSISADAIRYYEREGLLAPAQKSDAGYRLYDDHAVRRIRFIKQAQQCGFSLAEIRELLELKTRNNACCNDVKSVVIEKKLQLERKIKQLKTMSQALSQLITICDEETLALDACPILAALENSLAKRDKSR